MAIEIKSIPEDIREDAILRLIQHWQMEYQTASTVDPSSDFPVSGRAVYNFVSSQTSPASSYTSDISQYDNAEIGAFIQLDPTIIKGTTRKFIRCSFRIPNEGAVTNNFPPLFAGSMYDIECWNASGTPQEFAANFVPNKKSIALMWIFMNDEDNRIAYLYRCANLVQFQGDPNCYLWLSPLRRSWVGSSSVAVDQNPTSAQIQRCKIEELLFYGKI